MSNRYIYRISQCWDNPPVFLQAPVVCRDLGWRRSQDRAITRWLMETEYQGRVLRSLCLDAALYEIEEEKLCD